MFKKILPITWIRRLVQTAMLAVLGQWSFYGIFRCPYPVPFVDCQTCPVLTCWGRLTTLFWGVWILLPVSAIFFGRAFCAWACPGGLVNQMLGKLALFKARIRERFNLWAFWGLAASVSVASFIWIGMGNPRSMIPIRTGEFWDSIVLSFTHASPFWLTRTCFVLGAVAAGLIFANLWCRFFCPAGGVLELIKQKSLFGIFKTGACTNCDECLKVCEMGTRPAEINCTNCGDCLKSCSVGAIKIGRRKN